MNPILEFVCDRRLGARDIQKSRNLGVLLLTLGHESDAILRLAAITETEWHLEEALVEQALRDSGNAALLDEVNVVLACEMELVADYFAGKLTGPGLLGLMVTLSWNWEEATEAFWLDLELQLTRYGERDLSALDPAETLAFDTALQAALKKRGFSK